MSPERYPYSAVPERINYAKYGLFFALFYLFIIVLIGVFTMVTDIQIPSALSVVTAMAGGIYLGSKFYKDQGRAPDKAEKRKLCLSAMGGAIVVSAIPVAILIHYADPDIQQMAEMLKTGSSAAILGVSVLVALGLTYLMIGFGISQAIKIQLQAANKRRP